MNCAQKYKQNVQKYAQNVQKYAQNVQKNIKEIKNIKKAKNYKNNPDNFFYLGTINDKNFIETNCITFYKTLLFENILISYDINFIKGTENIIISILKYSHGTFDINEFYAFLECIRLKFSSHFILEFNHKDNFIYDLYMFRD